VREYPSAAQSAAWVAPRRSRIRRDPDEVRVLHCFAVVAVVAQRHIKGFKDAARAGTHHHYAVSQEDSLGHRVGHQDDCGAGITPDSMQLDELVDLEDACSNLCGRLGVKMCLYSGVLGQ
jgi:hypothetical protein